MGSLQNRAITAAGRILQFGPRLEEYCRVIASEAKQSSFRAEGMDRFVASAPRDDGGG
jgi:hypothetical protein